MSKVEARAGSAGHSAAAKFAAFAADTRFDDIPAAVRERGKLLILDALGVGLASNAYPFAAKAIAGVSALSEGGRCTVLGRHEKLPVRDAALANGILIHGLDYDDTHLTSIVHATAACLPTALSLAEDIGADGRALLTAYVIGMEAAIRIGAAVKGGFHHAGFHATGVISHFAASLIAGSLLGLTAEQIVSAQGITGSTAAGIQVFLEEGAWTKRFHPGWGAMAGITAARLAQHGFVGPQRPYEGKFGLFETHLQSHADTVDMARLTDGLGTVWDLPDTAIKPYPVCHFIHGAADAAIALHAEIGDPAAIDYVECVVPGPTLPIIVEPAAAKIAPNTDYEAKFSAQFVVATCLVRGRFGLAELEDATLQDPVLRGLSAKVRCAADPDTAFPAFFSGGVTVVMRDGRRLSRHVRVNSGAGERALDEAGISFKFRSNAAMSIGEAQAERIREAVLNLDRLDVRQLAKQLAAE